MKEIECSALIKKWERLTYKKKYNVLVEALGHMESYNGRSKALCVAMGMGYDNVLNADDYEDWWW